jgi:hypothetical protein
VRTLTPLVIPSRVGDQSLCRALHELELAGWIAAE